MRILYEKQGFMGSFLQKEFNGKIYTFLGEEITQEGEEVA
jgi:hypothetical protein